MTVRFEKALSILVIVFLVSCIVNQTYSIYTTHRANKVLNEQKEQLKEIKAVTEKARSKLE
ncbi:hypothetical protein J41TS4_22470 [Paenibacillus apis]|uniref:Uncharacterized protein n=1 Tax=Paenibacillus apis TaxID=1792174 RepID=A0A920CMA2_9BACL|nr:hypothetical protein J41TS4_22470 [Paenibacillus apis]